MLKICFQDEAYEIAKPYLEQLMVSRTHVLARWWGKSIDDEGGCFDEAVISKVFYAEDTGELTVRVCECDGTVPTYEGIDICCSQLHLEVL